MKRSFVFIAIAIFFGNTDVFAQEIISISDQDFVQINDCNTAVIISDSNADNGNYGPNEAFSITVCVAESIEESAVALISPQFYGHVWGVDANSELYVYDGPDSNSDLIGVYNSASFPDGLIINASGSCLTLLFISGEASTGSGFELEFVCGSAFENGQPIDVQINTDPPLEWDDTIGANVMNVCQGENFSASVSLDFPFSGLNYQQSAESTMIKWAFGGQSTYRGMGLTEVEHAYETGSGSKVVIDLTDSLGFNQQEVFYVRVSAKPEFSIALPENTLFCADQVSEVSGGLDDGVVIGAAAVSNGFQLHAFYGQELYLLDGGGSNYVTEVLVSGFDEDQTLTEADVLQSLCVNMEHSYLGDLEMMLTCPNGTSINVFDSYAGDGLFPGGFNGGGTFLGDAYDNGADQLPGIGFDYCFSMEAPFGTLGAELAAGNTVPVNTFNNGIAMAPGTYTPEESFASFIGCPLNGNWTLTVRDNLYMDDGFIFDWGVVFNIVASPDSFMYESPILSATWDTNSMILADNGSSISILPNANQNEDLVFRTTDEYGCQFTDTIDVQLVAEPSPIAPTQVCGLSIELPEPSPAGDWALISSTAASNEITFADGPDGYVTIVVAEPGEYVVNFTEAECGYEVMANLTFLDESDPECFLSTTTAIDPGSYGLSPNPASEAVKISFDIKHNSLAHIEVISIDGRITRQMQVFCNAGTQAIQADLNGIGDGFYVVRVVIDAEAFSLPLVIAR